MAAQYGVDFKQQQQLIKSLISTDCYDHETSDISLIETHISWVILTGPYAYKIKKSLNLGFLDYSTLTLRHQYCKQELRINRRTAADIYLDCVAISGPVDQPRLDCTDDVIDYAVKMHQFSQLALLSHLAEQDQLTIDIIDQLALSLVDFHHRIDRLAVDSSLGTPSSIWQPIHENFEQIAERIPDETTHDMLKPLLQWAEQSHNQLTPSLQSRKQQGFIRECHGDLHLGNIAYVNDRICMFDAIEFNPQLSWIDVMSELAFLCMDLEARGFSAYSYRLLNLYLQYSGDYSGLELLRFYQLYRAMVRAKVVAISLQQTASRDDPLHEQFHRYLDLAKSYTQLGQPCLIITHGLSGSGKTYYSQQLASIFQCIHLSSDIERKRLFGLPPLAISKQSTDHNIYSQQANMRTYQRLLDLSHELLDYGFSVIVDATFLRQSSRESFHQLAQSLDIPFLILNLQSNTDTLKQRIRHRQQMANNPSEADIAILEQQLLKREPLTRDEQDVTWSLISGEEVCWEPFMQHMTTLVK